MLRGYQKSSWVFHRDSDFPSNKYIAIIICHIDPGRVKYGDQPEVLLKVIILTWMVTIKIGSMVMDELAKGVFKKGDKRHIILANVTKRFREEETELRTALQRAKEKLLERWRAVNFTRRIVTDKEREKMSLAAQVFEFISFCPDMT